MQLRCPVCDLWYRPPQYGEQRVCSVSCARALPNRIAEALAETRATVKEMLVRAREAKAAAKPRA